MASVTVTYRMPDGAGIHVKIKAKNAYPDALSNARHEAVRCFKESLAEITGEATVVDVLELPETDS